MRNSPIAENRPQYKTKRIAMLASLQLVMTIGMAGMEIGNTIVDLYNANVYSGFWSFPFMLAATLATYISVCAKLTKKKTIVTMVLQCVAVFVLLIAIGFLVTFIATGFNKCIGIQCGTSTDFSSLGGSSSPSDSYYFLKKFFIAAELAFAILFLLLAVIYINIFIVCLTKLPYFQSKKVKPFANDPMSLHAPLTASNSFQPLPMLDASSHSPSGEHIIHPPSAIPPQYAVPQQMCPNCGHITIYQPLEYVVQCPKCGYESHLVQYAKIS